MEAVTAITTDGGSVSALKVRQGLKDGRTSEEIIPETADPLADLAPQALLDPDTGDLIVVWNRHDGRKLTLASSRRDATGTWTAIAYLDTGKQEPSDPEVALDTTSRLHVVFKVSEGKGEFGLRHRAYDLSTLQPVSDAVDPFAAEAPAPKREAAASPKAEAPTAPRAGKPAEATPSAGPAPGLTVAPGKPAAFTAYGVEAGCETAVVYRVAGEKLDIATLTLSKWSTGSVEMGSASDPATARSLAVEIARRFCRP